MTTDEVKNLYKQNLLAYYSPKNAPADKDAVNTRSAYGPPPLPTCPPRRRRPRFCARSPCAGFR